MPPRRRRIETPRRRWPLFLLFAGAILAGVALWAYAPILLAATHFIVGLILLILSLVAPQSYAASADSNGYYQINNIPVG